jgi:regulatory protein
VDWFFTLRNASFSLLTQETVHYSDTLVLESRHEIVYDKGMELLARREHSRKELKLKLVSRGFPEDDVQAVLIRLGETGALNEDRFAQRWLETRLRKKPEGASLLDAGLARKGVDRDTRVRALRDVQREFPELWETALERAGEALRKRSPDTETLTARLQRRGFGWSEIKRFINSIEEE